MNKASVPTQCHWKFFLCIYLPLLVGVIVLLLAELGVRVPQWILGVAMGILVLPIAFAISYFSRPVEVLLFLNPPAWFIRRLPTTNLRLLYRKVDADYNAAVNPKKIEALRIRRAHLRLEMQSRGIVSSPHGKRRAI